jgi:hypothetical protein
MFSRAWPVRAPALVSTRPHRRPLKVYHPRAGGQSQFSALLELEPKSDRIQSALAYAKRNLDKPLPVGQLAEAAHLNRNSPAMGFVPNAFIHIGGDGQIVLVRPYGTTRIISPSATALIDPMHLRLTLARTVPSLLDKIGVFARIVAANANAMF